MLEVTPRNFTSGPGLAKIKIMLEANSYLKKHDGFSLVETMICLGITAVVLMSIASVSLQLREVSVKSASRSAIDVARQNLVALVLNETSWKKTLDAHGNMACLKYNPGAQGQGASAQGQLNGQNPWCAFFPSLCAGQNGNGGGCGNVGRNQAQNFTIMDSYNQVAFNPAIHGFSESGQRCAGYPSGGCPYSFDVKWWATSNTAGAAVAVSIQMKLGANYGAANNYNSLGINGDRYSAPVIYRPAN